ncbi:MAG TPA: hypothetical protein VG028_10595 [Terriglobia bacterium]|nr:hypothetical protein [Terriglobia bacterium]
MTNILRFAALDVPPPGDGVTTVTATVPDDASWAAGIVAVNWVVVRKEVATAVPPNWTVDCDVNPDPVTVTTVLALPALMEFGAIEVSTGDGLTTWTVAEAVRLELVALVAVIVTVSGEGGVAGAVYPPRLLIVPTVAFPPATPLTDHVAAPKEAEKICRDWVVTFALLGETVAAMTVVFTLVPPQLERKSIPNDRAARVFILGKMAFFIMALIRCMAKLSF